MGDLAPYTLHIPQEQLHDLHDRLSRTRWPDDSPRRWGDGLPLDYARNLAEHWRDSYDWRAAEARINRHDQVTAEIDGHPVHAIHVRSPRADATPLALLHGWPGSIVEFLDIIPLLSDPGDAQEPAFHLVVPTLPGFGIGGPASGWNVERAAAAFVVLMSRLGYESYAVHGGDYGSQIARRMASQEPDRITFVHLTAVLDASATADDDDSDPEVKRSRDKAQRYQSDLGAYALLNATRPQSIGYGLNDSPVGLLAWIVERFRDWSGAADVPEEAVDRDLMLTNVALYWLFGTAASAARYYKEGAATWGQPMPEVTVPTAVALAPDDISRPVRSHAERNLNILRWTNLPAGGHFAAMEQPQAVAADLRATALALNHAS